jgi:hypothetical protein
MLPLQYFDGIVFSARAYAEKIICPPENNSSNKTHCACLLHVIKALFASNNLIMTFKMLFIALLVGTLSTSAWVFQNTPQEEISSNATNSEITPNPEELGKVKWLRDLADAQAEARKSGKPILILFQEVPGCSNCTHYGNHTLSHPLIVEAIETYFVPVCIYNNKGGKDAEALRQFGEPAWNNPVVRIVRADNYADLVLRMDNFRSSYQLVNGIRRALENTATGIPTWMELLEEEMASREAGVQTATFSMYCFWSGEGTFGDIAGVISTEAGFQNGKEVVQVEYDPTRIQRAELEALTQPKGIVACAKNEGFRVDKEPKYYLSQTAYRYIPMTTLQACRANSAIGKGQQPDRLLSPRQVAILTSSATKKKNMIGRTDLAKAWAEM